MLHSTLLSHGKHRIVSLRTGVVSSGVHKYAILDPDQGNRVRVVATYEFASPRSTGDLHRHGILADVQKPSG